MAYAKKPTAWLMLFVAELSLLPSPTHSLAQSVTWQKKSIATEEWGAGAQKLIWWVFLYYIFAWAHLLCMPRKGWQWLWPIIIPTPTLLIPVGTDGVVDVDGGAGTALRTSWVQCVFFSPSTFLLLDLPRDAIPIWIRTMYRKCMKGMGRERGKRMESNHGRIWILIYLCSPCCFQNTRILWIWT